jgi:hypothetical protein
MNANEILGIQRLRKMLDRFAQHQAFVPMCRHEW